MASRRRCPRPEKEQQQQQEHHRKLCGFITLVLEPCPAQGAQGDGELEQQLSRESHNAAARGGGKMDMAGAEPGAACWLEGRGAEACVVVEHSTVVLRPLGGGSGGNSGSSDSGSSPVDSSQSSVTVDEAQSPVCTSVQGHRPRRRAARGRKRKSQDPVAGLKRKGPAGSAACSSILQQLAVLVARNAADLQGRILGVSCRGGLARAVVMLDLYLPATFWSERNSWRPSVGIAAAFSHFSCDWKERRSMLERISASSDFMSSREPSIWDVGECLVLGCQLHKPLSDAEKQARFDLPTMFQSLPAYNNDTGLQVSCIQAHHGRGGGSGIWDIPDEILVSILTRLGPKDLVRVASVCRHTRSLAVSIMPCMKLKLFPHQQAAVSWMLQRELHPKSFSHPLFRELQTEDGLPYHVNCVTGELSPEFPHKEVKDFRGGLFCDEPGLGKTVTALSLILKTQGTLSEPPNGVQVRWCERLSQEKVGYYEINADASSQGVSMMKRCMMMKARSFNYGVAEDVVLEPCVVESPPVSVRGRKRSRASSDTEGSDSDYVVERPKTGARKSRGRSSQTRSRGSTTSNAPGPRRKLFEADISVVSGERPQGRRGRGRKSAIMLNSSVPRAQVPCDSSESHPEPVEIWVQCDACRKWRKLPLGMEGPKEGLAWFCSMNMDPDRQECSSPEESWGDECIRNLPGFVSIGVSPGQEQNVLFFKSVLKEHACLLDSETKKALEWLAGQNVEKLVKAATAGLELPPGLRLVSFTGDDRHHYFTLFRAFGLVESRGGRGVIRWRYPASLDNLILDSEALKIAYSEPVDGVRRLYLSRATLVVVPQNLVDHWKNQIAKHTKAGQLRVFVWVDQKNVPLAHNLAWDYDIVITTFMRLSMEWAVRETSPLMHIHWLRIMLDEGHTLGASLSLTNKLQMAMSMHASRRWILTGTPMPNTPSSQVAHLQPMLKFLHEAVYGKQQKSWEGAILRPFQDGREEGRSRLMDLLHRCMTSARKAELKTIPPCVRKIKLLSFTKKHAVSYNELVVTVKRNVLMADWNDPSHVESLLNPRQWKFRSNTIKNVRLSCCVAGNIKVRNAGEDIKETMDMLEEQGMDPASEVFLTIRRALLDGSHCDRCKQWCRLPIVTPCRHLLCLSCTALDSEKCPLPGCGNPYKMQSPADLTRPENPHPKWPVPQDLIELQPSYVQDNWNPDWQSTSSSKVSYLISELNALRVAYESQATENLEPDVRETSDEILFGMKHSWCTRASKTMPPKAIVFSQFLEHINVVEKQLSDAKLEHVGMYSPMHSVNKVKSLHTFQEDPECMVLVMDSSAALGLDLSFVTHVYLMEPIWDRSVEEQVVSRAHRLGATRPVLVETLAMSGTIEEQMLRCLQDSSKSKRPRHSEQVDNLDPSRPGYRTMHDFAESNYLAHLDCVRTVACEA